MTGAAVHIALPGTGHTIRRSLELLRPRLRERGVAVVTGEEQLRGVAGDGAVVVSVEAPAVLEGPVADTVEATARRVVEALGVPADLLFLTRRQDLLVARAPVGDGPVLYGELMERLRALPGVRSLRVRPLEAVGATAGGPVAELLELAGLDDVLDPAVVATLPRQDPVLSEPALRLARAFLPHVPEASRPQVLARLRRRFPAGRRYPVAPALPPAERRRVLDAHRADNETLFSTWMPDLPADGYAAPAAPAGAPPVVRRRMTVARLRQRWRLARRKTGRRLRALATRVRPRPLPPVPHLVLHVGLQKTGTTTLQWSLRRLRRDLRRRGIAYLDRLEMAGAEHYRGSAAFARTTPERAARFQAELAALAAREWATTRRAHGGEPRMLLLSNEAMVGSAKGKRNHLKRRFRPRAERTISEVISALRPQRTTVVLYVRRQDRLIESLYMHQVHHGATFDFQHFVRPALRRPTIRYTELVERLEAIPGVDEVRVRPFELISSGAHAFVADFLDGLGCGDLDVAALGEIPHSNPSYSDRALDVALSVNPETRTTRERRVVRHVLRNLYPTSESGAANLLTPEQRDELIAAYAEDNRKLFERWMPDLPADSYGSVEATEALSRARSAG